MSAPGWGAGMIIWAVTQAVYLFGATEDVLATVGRTTVGRTVGRTAKAKSRAVHACRLKARDVTAWGEALMLWLDCSEEAG